MKKVKVYSRQLLGLGMFLGSSLLINAQDDLAMVNVDKVKTENITINTSRTNATHSSMAVAQLSEHISSNVEYPEYLKDLEIEGKVVIEVRLDNTGQIIESHVIKRASKLLNEAVLNSLVNFDKLKMTDTKYQGVNTVHIPIQFTK